MLIRLLALADASNINNSSPVASVPDSWVVPLISTLVSTVAKLKVPEPSVLRN